LQLNNNHPLETLQIMQPKNDGKEKVHGDLFRSKLVNILDHRHPLFVLANQIEWNAFVEVFGPLYVENVGRPGIPIRIMVGLHYLKHAYNESDESVVVKFVENPYRQYFCGCEYFQHKLPIDPSSMTRWRRRVGWEGVEKLLKETVETAKRNKLLRRSDSERVNVDTTVQEKAIAFPTDARLYYKARRTLVREAKRRGIGLRQSYERVSKKAFCMQARYAHAQQFKRARRQARRLRTYLGRVIRDIRNNEIHPDEELRQLLEVSEQSYQQRRDDKNKTYSIWAPKVECISKGKAHKRYEFGSKVSVASTSRKSWVVGVKAVHHNPYDGHTLAEAIEQLQSITGWEPRNVFCDRGYRAATDIPPGIAVHLTGKKTNSKSLLRWIRRRSAIAPVIGYLKADHGMERNHLKGREGDMINAILSGCGFNLMKLMRAFALVASSRGCFLLLWIRRWFVSSINQPGKLLPTAA
jgi:IS5 family transposase